MPPWFLSLWYSDAAGGGLMGRPAWDEDKEMALECLGPDPGHKQHKHSRNPSPCFRHPMRAKKGERPSWHP